MTEQTSNIQIYQAADGKAMLEVKLDQETVWLTQKQMAILFDKDSDTIGLHIRNIYKDKELQQDATTEDSSVVQHEGNKNELAGEQHGNMADSLTCVWRECLAAFRTRFSW